MISEGERCAFKKSKNFFLELLFKRGELLDFDVPLEDKDGRLVYCSVNVKTEKNKKGEVIKIIGSLRDISERRMAREKISKLERAVEQSPSSVVITNLDGNIEYVNPKIVEVLGYSEDEMKSRSFVDFVHPDDRETVLEHYQTGLEGADVPNLYSFRGISKDGNKFFIIYRNRYCSA